MLTRVPGPRRQWVLNGYDMAQICEQGHIITMFGESRKSNTKKFCTDCGAPTITECSNCHETIRGYHHVANSRVIASVPDEAPAFCHNCGKAYPWTENKMRAATALIEEAEGLSDSEKEALTKSLPDLVRDVPATEVAVLRFKKYLPKAGTAVYNAFKSVAVSIVTEEVKKKLGL